MADIVKTWNAVRKYVNKYQLVFVLFLVMIFFVDDHNVFRQFAFNNKIKALRSEIRVYEQKKAVSEKKLKELYSNDDDLEKFAREEYLMKKDNEDIFVVQ